MRRRNPLGLVCLIACFVCVAESAAAAQYHASGVVDVELPFADGSRSWVNEGLGKLYYDESDDRRLHVAFAGLDFGADFGTQHGIRGTLVYGDGPRGGVQVSEFYYQYRPVSLSARRYHFRVGAFFPALSLENVGTAWSSPYGLTTSVANSWVQEEIRATGAQFTTTWLGRYRDSRSDISLTGGLLYNNDPAGAMLSWRGWAGHQRILGWGKSLPAPWLPFMAVSPQVQKFEPFEELDHRPGGYLMFHLERSHWAVMGAWYHNGAETDLLIDGQYTWRTRFVDVGARWWNDEGWEVLAQWIYGDTKMESSFRPNVVVNDYDAGYLLVSKRWNRHRVLVRLESFGVRDRDEFPIDDNYERGGAITALYGYRANDNWEFDIEAVRVASTRDARAYLGVARRQVESELRLGVRFLW